MITFPPEMRALGTDEAVAESLSTSCSASSTFSDRITSRLSELYPLCEAFNLKTGVAPGKLPAPGSLAPQATNGLVPPLFDDDPTPMIRPLSFGHVPWALELAA